ncbi:MAG TPA: squalene/phytoene synthase family protein [Caulobacteraceae bacterium]
MTAGVDLDGEVRRVDPDRWLASRFIADPARRADVIALYDFDHQLTRASALVSNPMAAEIRLVWWREAVAEIFSGIAVRRHPAAEALATAVRRGGLPREAFEAMIAARIGALETRRFETVDALNWARSAQGCLAGLAALSLGGNAVDAAPAGLVWGLTLLRRSGKAVGPAADACLRDALSEARRAARQLPAVAFPAALCATLALADLSVGSPSELEKRWRLSWAALTGRL